MKKVEDKVLIARLENEYHSRRYGARIRGIETTKKEWYYDSDVDMYQLFRIKNGQPIQPAIFGMDPKDI